MYKDIPAIWIRAYGLICLWYLINFGVSVTSEYVLEAPFSHTIYTGIYLYITLCLAVIIIWLWSNLLFRFRVFIQVIGHVLGLILSFLILGSVKYYTEFFMDDFLFFEEYKEFLIELLNWDAFQFNNQYLTAVFIYYIIRYVESLKQKEQEKRELEFQNKEIQFSLLKSQINPHFLFNTLNSISMLMSSSKEKARAMISQLSDIFRYALDSSRDEVVTLKDEMEFIENYIRIQKVRFQERLNFETDIDEDCNQLKLPPMVLQPLVENAVKHGIDPKDDGGTIRLKVTKNKTAVRFTVEDNGLGSRSRPADGKKSTGIGLKNSDQRLRTMFGNRSGIRVHRDENGFRASFKIPIIQ